MRMLFVGLKVVVGFLFDEVRLVRKRIMVNRRVIKDLEELEFKIRVMGYIWFFFYFYFCFVGKREE